MTFTFFSNFLNHHQKPFCDEMVKAIGDNFHFISTIPVPNQLLKGGYSDYENVKYNILTHRSKSEQIKAYQLAQNSDVVIFGSSDRKYLKGRLRSKKLTFIYSERLLKKSRWMKFNPRVLRFMYRLHTKFRNKNIHLLCASGFVSNDMQWVFAYPNKMYKWGYFTNFETLPIKSLLVKKNKAKRIKLLWVARFIPLKHPMLIIKLAKYLRQMGYLFEITMIGQGRLFNLIEQEVRKNNLEDLVVLAGNRTNQEVLDFMRISHIFLMTSDRREGWGAVINEALSNGCAVVASSEIGSSPFLIEPEINGLIFKSKCIDSLIQKVESIINDSEKRSLLALNAYEDMRYKWSPRRAVKNILQLSDLLLKNESANIDNGPCSKAQRTSKSWYLTKRDELRDKYSNKIRIIK